MELCGGKFQYKIYIMVFVVCFQTHTNGMFAMLIVVRLSIVGRKKSNININSNNNNNTVNISIQTKWVFNKYGIINM